MVIGALHNRQPWDYRHSKKIKLCKARSVTVHDCEFHTLDSEMWLAIIQLLPETAFLFLKVRGHDVGKIGRLV